MSPPSVETMQHAIDRLEALDRHGDREHQLVLLVDALGRRRVAAQRGVHFAVDAAVAAGLEIGLELREGAHAHDAVIDAGPQARVEAGSRNRAAAVRRYLHHIARQQIARVDQRAGRRCRKARARSCVGAMSWRSSGSAWLDIDRVACPRWSCIRPASLATICACCSMPVSRSSTRPTRLDCTTSTPPIRMISANALKKMMRAQRRSAPAEATHAHCSSDCGLSPRRQRARSCATLTPRDSDSRRRRAFRWHRNRRRPP